ncbi:MAG: T9SS type A sorting domain-containing protein, partial [Bacteroidales bacterium]|nr:T9SS type A sorting domain-containing protein [Bacteroidales bacterium]
MDYADSCYIEELPYKVGGWPMQDFGEHTERYVTTAGCDSVCKYVLTRRWHGYNVQVKVRGGGSVNVTDTVLREDASLWLSFSASSCYRLNSLRVNGKAVPLQGRYLLQNLHGDCTVAVDFASLASAETRVVRRVCVDSLPLVYNGETYGVGEHEILLRNAAGCDSVIRLQVQGKENTARIAVLDTIAPPCGASEISFSYAIEAGAPKHLRLMYDAAAKSAGFRDTVLAVGATGTQTVRIALPPSVHSDRYGLQLLQADGTGCYVEEEPLSFEIPYPSNIIVQKWSDVLAVLSAEYNGGYEFSGYQWLRNGEPIEGETRPYYYAKPYLRSGDTYAVLLERASDGLKLPSCGVKRKGYPKGFSLELLPNPVAAGEAVQVSVDGKPNAEGTIEVFDGTGKPVYQRTFRRNHTLRLSVQPGSYVVRVRDAKATWTATGKLVIR